MKLAAADALGEVVADDAGARTTSCRRPFDPRVAPAVAAAVAAATSEEARTGEAGIASRRASLRV